MLRNYLAVVLQHSLQSLPVTVSAPSACKQRTGIKQRGISFNLNNQIHLVSISDEYEGDILYNTSLGANYSVLSRKSFLISHVNKDGL